MHSEVVEEIPYHRFNTKYKKKSGRPSKTTERERRLLTKLCKKDSLKSAGELKCEWNPENRYQLPQLRDFCESISYLAKEQPGNRFSARHIRKTDYCGVDITDIGPRKIGKRQYLPTNAKFCCTL